jgi:hypothetical protein
VQERPYFCCGSKWNYTDVCTVKPYDILKVKNACVLRHGMHRLQCCSRILSDTRCCTTLNCMQLVSVTSCRLYSISVLILRMPMCVSVDPLVSRRSPMTIHRAWNWYVLISVSVAVRDGTLQDTMLVRCPLSDRRLSVSSLLVSWIRKYSGPLTP